MEKECKGIAIAVLAFAVSVGAQVVSRPGKWLDTTKDTQAANYIVFGGEGKLLLTEDYEVVKTHEICASLTGYFLDKSELGRYNVNFKGMRTSATFTFTTQYDAEKWVEKWCTPESLTSIKAGRGTFVRNY